MDGARNMNKNHTMLAVNKKRNKRKIDTAKKEIYKMLENGEKVTVTKLIEQTGLSRGFFYKNPLIREELDNAIKNQGACYNPRQVIIDKAMNNTLMILKSEIRKVKAQNKELQLNNQELCEQNECLNKEVENLKKQLGRKEIGLLKKL